MRRAARGIRVQAWITYTDGAHRSVEAYVGEWTARAVHLRWRTPNGIEDLWVWANAVSPIEEHAPSRRPSRQYVQGVPATDRSNLVARRSR